MQFFTQNVLSNIVLLIDFSQRYFSEKFDFFECTKVVAGNIIQNVFQVVIAAKPLKSIRILLKTV